jgi:hypothetical protein
MKRLVCIVSNIGTRTCIHTESLIGRAKGVSFHNIIGTTAGIYMAGVRTGTGVSIATYTYMKFSFSIASIICASTAVCIASDVKRGLSEVK